MPWFSHFILALLAWSCRTSVYGFNLKLNAISTINLAQGNASAIAKSYFEYPKATEDYERFTLLNVDPSQSYLTLGARNRLVTVNSNDFERVQVYESHFPIKEKALSDKNCSDRNCANYILATLPLYTSTYNRLICGSYYGLYQCAVAEQSPYTGTINSYDLGGRLIKAPKAITMPLNNRNAFILSHNVGTEESQNVDIIYAAASWTDNSQFLSAHISRNNYQDETLSKKIGVSKSFVRFLDTTDRLFLFQNENSYDIDDGEKDRDILISTSLVSQVCKNDHEVLNGEMPFYSELTAKIYCFNEAFRSNSGNSRNFKFDSLEFVTDLIELRDANQTRRLFYGVFNTPRNQITGTAICFFDMNDLASVFQKSNFKYIDSTNEQAAKNSQLNPQDCSARLSPIEKLKYKAFTSKLSYMTKAALPVRKRKASFITTNDYRITCLYVVESTIDSNSDVYANMQPTVRKLDQYDHLNIVFIGTDNGKLMRIAHYFTNDYFRNDELAEEHVEILEEIQLFDRNTTIRELTILKGDTNKKLFAVSERQVKAVSLDFCELFSESCETCVRNNNNELYASKCFWIENTCQSKRGHRGYLNESSSSIFGEMKHCEFLAMRRTSTTTTTAKSTSTIIKTRKITTTKPIPTAKNYDFNDSSWPAFIKRRPAVSGTYLTNIWPKIVDHNMTTDDVKNLLNETVLNSEAEEDRTSKSNTLSTILLIGMGATLIALLFGILIGYLVKASYSKKLLERLDPYFSCGNNRKSAHAGSGKNSNHKSLSTINNTTLTRTPSTSTTSEASNIKTLKAGLVQHRQALEHDINQSIMHKIYSSIDKGLECNMPPSTSRPKSATPPSIAGQKQIISFGSSNTSERDSAISCNNSPSSEANATQFADTRRQQFYTIQNDYGVLPRNLTESHRGGDYFLSSPPGNDSPNQVKLSSFNGSSTRKTQSPRHHVVPLSKIDEFMSRFSSNSNTTDTSLYGLFGLVNSQTCLLNNGGVSGASGTTSKSSTSSCSSEDVVISDRSKHVSNLILAEIVNNNNNNNGEAVKDQHNDSIRVSDDCDSFTSPTTLSSSHSSSSASAVAQPTERVVRHTLLSKLKETNRVSSSGGSIKVGSFAKKPPYPLNSTRRLLPRVTDDPPSGRHTHGGGDDEVDVVELDDNSEVSSQTTNDYIKNCLNEDLINYSKIEDALFMNNSYV